MNTVIASRKILNGEYTLRKKENLKSKVWEMFCLILDEMGEVIPNLIACSSCKKVYNYDNRRLGTSSLLRHKCLNIKGHVKQTVSLPPQKCESLIMLVENKNRILEGCVKFVCNDLRPMEMVTECGFKNLMETFLRIGATQRINFDLEDVLPNPTDISGRIMLMAQKARDDLAVFINSHLAAAGGGITLETWTDVYKNSEHLSVTLHFAQNSMICSRILGSVILEQGYTGERVADELFQILRRYGFLDHLKNFVFVTSHGDGVNAALKLLDRINCAAHLINNVLDVSTSSDNQSMALLQGCIDIAKFCQNTYLRNRLPSDVEDVNARGWNSILRTFCSVMENWEEIRGVCLESNQADLIFEVEKAELSDLTEYLKPFHQALTELEGGKYPTLFLVHLWHLKLTEHFEPGPSDSNTLESLKTSAKAYYMENVEIHPVHKVSVFLHPLLKSLKMFKAEERIEIYEVVKNSVDCIKKEWEPEMGSASPCSSKQELDIKEYKMSDTLSQFMDTETILNKVAPDELAAYIDLKISDAVIKDFDLLQWWDGQKNYLPNLSRLAKRIFAIPAVTNSSERCFSLAEKDVIERRNNFDPILLDDILFLNSYFKSKRTVHHVA
ncbi:hypothetical protein J437_LFUL008186 [Ladona fulva]|uniref:BED-type domain-containing protein n=1 Tax=Ladona fulva TaxID=123851 RepID=A0A8K0P288_LADFU|nr:hypothetical protein J437_LFUL008186 [Ladona fulva]